MWFKREYSGYGCPMCGRLPVLAEGQTEKYCETLKAVKTNHVPAPMSQKAPLYKLVQRPCGCKHQLETRR